MKLIVGLGNPGREYEHTRHNAGFDVLDRLADLLNTGISQSKFNALITTVRTGQETILLMKPQTYMNNSGEAVIQAVQFYKIPVDQILVIHDDLDLPVGKIRIRTSGSAEGNEEHYRSSAYSGYCPDPCRNRQKSAHSDRRLCAGQSPG